MANRLSCANNPPQDGEILLSGFAHVALQMEAQRRLTRPAKTRRGKKRQKKQPQRGLGVAQLEKIRLEEQRRASEQAQQLAALHQLHGQALFYPHPPPSIIPHDRESSNHALVSPDAARSALAWFPSFDGNGTLNPSGIIHRNLIEIPSKAGPLQLFPGSKLLPRSIVESSSVMWAENLSRKVDEGSVESDSKLLGSGQNHEGEGSLSHHPLRLENAFPVIVRRQSSFNQMPIPFPSSLERMMELSSFQSVCRTDGSATKSQQAAMQACIKRRACAIVPPSSSSKLSDMSAWRSPPVDGQQLPMGDHEADLRSYARGTLAATDVCALTLRPPGDVEPTLSLELENGGAAAARRQAVQRCGQERDVGPHNFLSLAVPGTAWKHIVAQIEPLAATLSPVRAATTKSSATVPDTSTDEYVSTPISRWSCPGSNFLSDGTQSETSLPLSPSLDLTLKL